MLYVLLLGFAVSLDAFTAGAAYGLKSITVPLQSMAVIGVITALCTGAAMAFSYYLGSFLNTHVAVIAGSLLLISIGAWNIFCEYLTKRRFCQTAESSNNCLTFRLGRIVINIMADPETADMDNSRSINSSEAILLGLALGIDNFIATFAAALIKPLPLYTPAVMAFIQVSLIAAGISAAARLASDDLKKRFPYIPGAILIILGLLRLV
ncbi:MULTISPECIES: sporulation membrane protein YtaF [Sporomusa]|jgi:putative sporulation protein YtaF|uniref:sporulation membrane protein YtaF n=1 Tax=Sporomusa TaxID=2375 RepID=UPI002030FAD6|nr:sporulation membrane protein YtaF [Sporomusa sphaeroides]MCM0759758.1 sporulation membrane protein YtaF [Sporomusa sphaeroides DSM 2875]HML35580.1 sporulation membrane protein YtaF [Sporomusa sphaeroides]